MSLGKEIKERRVVVGERQERKGRVEGGWKGGMDGVRQGKGRERKERRCIRV